MPFLRNIFISSIVIFPKKAGFLIIAILFGWIINSGRTQVTIVDSATCEFSCKNGVCVPFSDLRDGEDDCGDYSDEDCLPWYYTCPNTGVCISAIDYATNNYNCTPAVNYCDSPPLNDCSPFATCINTGIFYKCICPVNDTLDVSPNPKFPGRICRLTRSISTISVVVNILPGQTLFPNITETSTTNLSTDSNSTSGSLGGPDDGYIRDCNGFRWGRNKRLCVPRSFGIVLILFLTLAIAALLFACCLTYWLCTRPRNRIVEEREVIAPNSRRRNDGHHTVIDERYGNDNNNMNPSYYFQQRGPGIAGVGGVNVMDYEGSSNHSPPNRRNFLQDDTVTVVRPNTPYIVGGGFATNDGAPKIANPTTTTSIYTIATPIPTEAESSMTRTVEHDRNFNYLVTPLEPLPPHTMIPGTSHNNAIRNIVSDDEDDNFTKVKHNRIVPILTTDEMVNTIDKEAFRRIETTKDGATIIQDSTLKPNDIITKATPIPAVLVTSNDNSSDNIHVFKHISEVVNPPPTTSLVNSIAAADLNKPGRKIDRQNLIKGIINYGKNEDAKGKTEESLQDSPRNLSSGVEQQLKPILRKFEIVEDPISTTDYYFDMDAANKHKI